MKRRHGRPAFRARLEVGEDRGRRVVWSCRRRGKDLCKLRFRYRKKITTCLGFIHGRAVMSSTFDKSQQCSHAVRTVHLCAFMYVALLLRRYTSSPCGIRPPRLARTLHDIGIHPTHVRPAFCEESAACGGRTELRDTYKGRQIRKSSRTRDHRIPHIPLARLAMNCASARVAPNIHRGPFAGATIQCDGSQRHSEHGERQYRQTHARTL